VRAPLLLVVALGAVVACGDLLDADFSNLVLACDGGEGLPDVSVAPGDDAAASGDGAPVDSDACADSVFDASSDSALCDSCDLPYFEGRWSDGSVASEGNGGNCP